MSDEQKLMINYFKTIGFGYKKFAENIEKQGWCSENQWLALQKMRKELSERQLKYSINREKNKGRSSDYGGDISEEEAMSFGEYF